MSADNIDGFQEILKEYLEEIPMTSEALLVGGIVIAEWMRPDGTRFLTRNAIGEIPDWQVQGYLFSSLHGNETWDNPESAGEQE
jgi:hypothetical protein